MEVEARRIRRFGPQRPTRSTLLPLQASSSSSHNVSNTVSCWYCDYKISYFNKPLFHFGRRYSRFLKAWFSIGAGFALSALVGVTLILLWELAKTLHLFGGSNKHGSFVSTLLFGFPSSQPGLSLSLADAGYICFSTIISVLVHEFGHAVAATSEGIQIEYIAIFIAILFPGALVAFNYEWLETLPHLTALRVYSAGIWHNAVEIPHYMAFVSSFFPFVVKGTRLWACLVVFLLKGLIGGNKKKKCCAACGLVLFLLPMILFPFYSSGHSPMVLNVPPTSPLSGYLAPGDVILSVDNVPIRNAQEWLKLHTLTYNVKLNNVNVSQSFGDVGVVNKMKGYCVPNFMLEESKISKLLENKHACPSDLAAFVKSLCSANVTLDDGQNETDLLNGGETDLLNREWSTYCLNAKDVVKRSRCGDEWGPATMNGGSCSCPQDELCLAPVQEPGSVWVEIAYSSSHECLPHVQNKSSLSETSGVKGNNCGGTFIFVGDLISMAHSIQLTPYQPRWGPQIVAYFPNLLERILIWTFHVSLALALLNGLPVYFLDGESILDATLSHFTLLSPRKRKKILRLCLLGGSLISIIVCLRELL